MRLKRLEFLRDLVGKGLEFKSNGHYDSYEIVGKDDILIENYGYRCEMPEYYEMDDICFISFKPQHMYIEVRDGENSTTGITFECENEFMKLLNPNEYYKGDDAKNVLVRMLKEGKKFKIDEYMDSDVSWKSNSVIILVDDRPFLKFGALRPNKNAENRDGFFIDDIEEMLVYKDCLHIAFKDMFSFLFGIKE